MELAHRPGSQSTSDDTYVARAFTPGCVGLRPFSVAHVEQPSRNARAPGDFVIRWKRRSRALSADSWNAVKVPLAQETESYEVEILDGAAVKRTLTTSTNGVTYTAAQQNSDFGALLGRGDTINIHIFQLQLSALVGRGAAKTVTLNL